MKRRSATRGKASAGGRAYALAVRMRDGEAIDFAGRFVSYASVFDLLDSWGYDHRREADGTFTAHSREVTESAP